MMDKVSVDPAKLTSLDDIKQVYERLSKEEALLAEQLEWSVGNRHHLEAKLSQLAHLVPTLQLVQTDAKQLQNTISFTHQLANTVSAKVRQLDLAKSRVVETQKRVGDLLDLEGCSGGVSMALTQEDYETAAAHIHRFLAMDETVLRHSADSSSKAESVETWFDRLREAEIELSGMIIRKFDEAVKKEDMASVDRFFKLFPLLNRHEEGLNKFTTYLCSKIQETTAANVESALKMGSRDKRSHIIWADTLTLLFEGIARTIEVRQPIIETYYGPGQLVLVVEVLQKECDRQAGRIICEMRKSRRLEHITDAVQESLRSVIDSGPNSKVQVRPDVPDPRELDTLLGELTLMNARAELYMRFIRRRVIADFEISITDTEERMKKENSFACKLSRSQLACDMAVIVGIYTILEQFYLNESFKKAVAMDLTEGESQTSSLVDDAFYIIKKSIRRAIASSSTDGICAMINHSVNLIETQLAAGFHQTLRKGFPAQGYLDLTQAYTVLQSSLQSGKMNSSTADSDALRRAFLTALNNGNVSLRHISSLHQSLEENINTTITGLTTNARAKLDSCLGDLKSTTIRVGTVVEFGMSQLRATAVKPRVKPWVDQFTATSHNITEIEFAGYEANDPFSQTLMVQVDGLLGSFLPLLSASNYKSLVALLVEEVATQLEKAVLKSSFNRLGGLQFDREVRAIVGYLSQVSEWGVREQLARLTQMATLLNLENLSEVCEYSNTTTWRLTPSEMRQVLQLRVDFKLDDIRRLKL